MKREEFKQYAKKNNLVVWSKEQSEKAEKALELIGHLNNRPCEACEYHDENGCHVWNCVFNGALGIKDI